MDIKAAQSCSSELPSPPARRVVVVVPAAPGTAPPPGSRALECLLEAQRIVVETITGEPDTLAAAEMERPALAIVRLRLGDAGGFAMLGAIDRRWPGLPVLVLSERPAVAEAVHAMRAGAVWYGGISLGSDFERALQSTLASGALHPHRAEPAGRLGGRGSRIVGASDAVRRMLGQSALVAPTRTTVLLLGETGTGKERLAQALHEASPRRNRPFVAVNCAALAETLLESELFGHEKGAFSGAHGRREGRFKAADGGTIFLDEIGEISLAMQVKLLRVLQERCFERVGGNQSINVDVRIIAATNRDLRDMVEQKTFRADLFYRLNVMTIMVPPLRERRGDLPLLVEHFLPRLALELGLPEAPVSPAAMEQLAAYAWPGNVRELENTLQRALVMAQGAPITRFELPDVPPAPPPVATDPALPRAPVVPGASFREIERHAIMVTYEACGRSPSRTAEVLGLSPRTVHYRLREYRGAPGRRLFRSTPEGPRPGSGDPGPLHFVHPGAGRAASSERSR